MRLWDDVVEEALEKLESLKLLRALRPIHLSSDQQPEFNDTGSQLSSKPNQEGQRKQVFQVFEEMHLWDRSSVEVQISQETFRRWLRELPSTGTFYFWLPFLSSLARAIILSFFWVMVEVDGSFSIQRRPTLC